MKVACHQARERPSTTIGEIKAEHSYMATYNQTNDIPDVNNLAVIIDEKQTENGKLRRVACKEENVVEKTKEEIGSTNRHCCNSLKALASNNRDMVVVAEINTQIDSRKKEEEEVGPVDFLNGSNQEPDVSGQAIISKKKSTGPENILKRSTNVSRVWDERAMFGENPAAKFIAGKERAKRMTLPVLTVRNVSINPADAMSRMNPARSRAKSAWTRDVSFESKLGIISEENETKDLQENLISVTRGRTISRGHLARMKEWMAVRLINKEKTEAILKRK